MKVVFCSNYMNHHQLYLSQALIKEGVDYTFIANEKISQERIDNGWEDMNDKYDFVLKKYEGEKNEIIAKKLIIEADLVIIGSYPIKNIRKRIFMNKPVFIYNERFFKCENGDIKQFKTVHNFFSNLLHFTYLNFFNVFILCASGYTAYDLNSYYNFIGKCYKWGYFPKLREYDLDALIEGKRKNKIIKLTWVSRFIELKHPEYIIYLAKKLKEEGVLFDIDMIGVGELLENIEKEIASNDLKGCVHLLGSMTNDEVLEHLKTSNIFLFTSDFNEGWGVALNEAMNSACAPVVSQGIGSVPFLIKDNDNGYIYSYGNKEEFYQLTKKLIVNDKEREQISRKAYRTIAEEWNPNNAAKKLIKLYDYLINKKGSKIEEGVCSKAEILSSNWNKE